MYTSCSESASQKHNLEFKMNHGSNTDYDRQQQFSSHYSSYQPPSHHHFTSMQHSPHMVSSNYSTYFRIHSEPYVGNYHRYTNESQGSTQSLLRQLSQKERNFVNDRKNWYSDEKYNEVKAKLKAGDDAHERCDYGTEGWKHRSVQEDIRRQGGVGSCDVEGKDAYSWNALYVHHADFINEMKKDGFSFEDTFEYIGRHYYLKENAYNHAISKKYGFDKTGSSSIVNPNMKHQSREISRSTNYDDSQSSPGVPNYFPSFCTQQSRAFCENIGRNF